MGKIYRLRGRSLTLSTGTIVDITSYNFGEAMEAVDDLLNTIVMEHMEKIFKTYNQTGEDLTAELIVAEVEHIVENELSDNLEGMLKFFLMTLSIQRYIYITDEVRKRQKKRENQGGSQ